MVSRIERGTDVQSYCNNASQVSNAFEIDMRGYKQCRKRKHPAHFSRHTALLRYKNVGDFLYDKYDFLPLQRFIQCETHSALVPKGKIEHTSWVNGLDV
jgi:hypothetical protein